MKRQSFENGFEREQGTWSEPIVGAQGMRRLQMSRLAPWKKTSPNSFSSWITWKIHFTSLAVFHIRFLTPWSWESMNKWLSISKVRVAHLHPNDSLQQLMGLIVFLVFSQCLLHVPQVSAPYTEMTSSKLLRAGYDNLCESIVKSWFERDWVGSLNKSRRQCIIVLRWWTKAVMTQWHQRAIDDPPGLKIYTALKQDPGVPLGSGNKDGCTIATKILMTRGHKVTAATSQASEGPLRHPLCFRNSYCGRSKVNLDHSRSYDAITCVTKENQKIIITTDLHMPKNYNEVLKSTILLMPKSALHQSGISVTFRSVDSYHHSMFWLLVNQFWPL